MRGVLAAAFTGLLCLAAGADVLAQTLPSNMAQATIRRSVAPSALAIDSAVADARRPDADRARDEQRHPTQILTFAGMRPGLRVADIGPGGGYYTRLFAVAVGDEGKVYAIDRPNAAPDRPRAILAVAPLYRNVTVVQQGYQNWSAGEPLDVIFISQIYHDFHVTPSAPASGGPAPAPLDVPAINRMLFAALKPGGVLVVIDHSAVQGSPATTPTTLHRIDRDQVVRELQEAGFRYDDSSSVLRNEADNRTSRVFESDIRGRTDQFVLRFVKPAPGDRPSTRAS